MKEFELKKLPKWVQREIKVMLGRITSLEQEIRQRKGEEETNTFLQYRPQDKDEPLPRDSQVLKYKMPDITCCQGIGCPIKETCYRYVAGLPDANVNAYPNIWQSYFTVIPYDFEKQVCEDYWGI